MVCTLVYGNSRRLKQSNGIANLVQLILIPWYTDPFFSLLSFHNRSLCLTATGVYILCTKALYVWRNSTWVLLCSYTLRLRVILHRLKLPICERSWDIILIAGKAISFDESDCEGAEVSFLEILSSMQKSCLVLLLCSFNSTSPSFWIRPISRHDLVHTSSIVSCSICSSGEINLPVRMPEAPFAEACSKLWQQQSLACFGPCLYLYFSKANLLSPALQTVFLPLFFETCVHRTILQSGIHS